MNQNILKYSFNKYGLEFLKYILEPQNLVTLIYFQINQKIAMNPTCGKQLVKHFTDLVNDNNYLYTSLSSHNIYILKYDSPDPEKLILDFYIYLQEQKDILKLYNLLKANYKNVVFYPELGIIFILPSNITERDDDENFKFHYIIQITILIKSVNEFYELYNKEANNNMNDIPKTNDFQKIKYKENETTLCIHKEAIDRIENYFINNKPRKINNLDAKFVNNFLDYYINTN
jgi:hypothetical protein